MDIVLRGRPLASDGRFYGIGYGPGLQSEMGRPFRIDANFYLWLAKGQVGIVKNNSLRTCPISMTCFIMSSITL